ncbi:ABC transporter ATP-binding protein [Roseomonas marmotae]|uniref:ABC transporter ATP-binding protein n=1 Tax=Roseomonas marmotae TaxID=2768161 RepID=A0ABS3KB49_9PROT|nr:ATP-binding cassette domain-containing protein [Roseomonas marmotae]MBO1074670.1 ABC transporter ATP-binding protein [Roseomonas marmotae]QTI81689.1 ABC transporter ATP-binding protein [Roseomonas marmotae]
MSAPLLELRHVSKTYGGGGLLRRRQTHAVKDVSFDLRADVPEVFAIIGESGSGKSTLARMILNSVAPSEGAILFKSRDLSTIRGAADRLEFMRAVQPIFQNPFESFNPLTRVDRYLHATARHFTGARNLAAQEEKADEALRKVGLSITEIRGRFPHELSGGQLQRVAIARALIPGPSLLVADEPVSMIDASLRMTVVNLFRALRDELGVSIVYITHDLATAYYISNRIVIMQRGVVVEAGDARSVLTTPQHPYSILLKESVLSVEAPDDGPEAGRSSRGSDANLPA